MAKSDLLKEAIADAKAVKETALANAKIALEEAFAPRIQSMLSAKLSEEMMEDEEMDMGMDMEAPADDMEMDAPMDAPTVTVDGEEYVKADDAGEVEMDDMDMDMSTDEGMMYDVDEDPTDDMSNEDLELEAIIRELEEDLDEEMEDETIEESIDEDAHNSDAAESTDSKGNDLMAEPKEMKNEDFNIDEIIEEILSEDDELTEEMEDDKEKVEEEMEDDKEKVEELAEELTEAYDTIESLRGTINEVNLLNAKLLYTNKLFRNFELSENQKMTVIENFDRAGNTREVKLVFSTLAESFQLPVKKRAVVKESFASKATGTTAPSKEATKQIINEGNQLANRWKKLAGLL